MKILKQRILRHLSFISRINPWSVEETLKFFYGLKDFVTKKKSSNFMLDLPQVAPFPTTFVIHFQDIFNVMAGFVLCYDKNGKGYILSE